MTIEQSFLRYRCYGDVAALGAVFDATAQELALVAAHLAAPGVEPEDLVQATFVAAIEHPDRWDHARPLTPWLIGILVNHARRERQRARRQPAACNARAAAPDPLDQVELQEVGTRVAEALRGLPRHYRQVLTLRLLHGLQPAQIATALGCPIATCKTRLQRGLELLRRALPAGISTSLAVLLVAGRGLASCREVVIAKAVDLVAASAASASVLTGVLMKKFLVVVGVLAFVATAVVLWSPASGDAPRLEPPASPLTGEVALALPAARATEAPSVRSPAIVDRDQPVSVNDAATIRGRVLDPAGRALPDVLVALGRASPGGEFSDVSAFLMQRSYGQPPNLPPERRGQTDLDGRFSFAARLREQGSVLTAWSETRGAAFQPLPADMTKDLRDELVLVLPDHGQIFGRVIGDDGQPLAAVIVDVYPADSGMPAATCTSDAEGRYRLVPLAQGSYRLAGQSPLHVWMDNTVAELGKDDQEVELRLALLPVLSAQLVDSRQSPWTGVRLENECGVDLARFEVLATRQSCERRAEAARGGGELIRLRYDEVSARVLGPIRDRDVAFVSLWWGEARLAEVSLVNLEQKTIEVAPTRPPMQVLHVRLAFDPHPQTPVRTTIRLDRPARDSAVQLENEVTTTIEGFEAQISVPATDVPTAWWLSVEAEGYALCDASLRWPADTDLLVHDVRLARAIRSVHGVVIGPDGAPLEGAHVLLLAADGAFVGRRKNVSASTDRLGAFSIENLPHRGLRLLVDGDQRGMAAIDVPDDSHMPLRVVASSPRLFVVPGTDGQGAQLRVLDATNGTLVDDRLNRCIRYGAPLKVWVTGEPRRIEVFLPGSPMPCAQGERRGDDDTFDLLPTAK